MTDDKGRRQDENPTQMEVLLKDFLSWSRQPTGSGIGYSRMETVEEWQAWFERGAFIREKAYDLFQELAVARTGGDPGSGERL